MVILVGTGPRSKDSATKAAKVRVLFSSTRQRGCVPLFERRIQGNQKPENICLACKAANFATISCISLSLYSSDYHKGASGGREYT